MLSRRLLIVGSLALGLALSGCAKSSAPIDEAGRPLEDLKIVTASGEHDDRNRDVRGHGEHC